METIISDKRRFTRRDVAELLASPTSLPELGLENALKVVNFMAAQRLKAGTVLFKEGTRSHKSLVLILQGDVLVENESAGDSSLVVTVLGAGHLVGELGVLDGKPRSATCTAVTEVDVAVLDQEDLERIMRDDPAAGVDLLRAMVVQIAARLRSTNHRVFMLSQIVTSMQQEIKTLQNADESPASANLNHTASDAQRLPHAAPRRPLLPARGGRRPFSSSQPGRAVSRPPDTGASWAPEREPGSGFGSRPAPDFRSTYPVSGGGS
jgi:CRP/FNR family cyclic AMP-dependent transcriptional regulator